MDSIRLEFVQITISIPMANEWMLLHLSAMFDKLG